MRYLSLRVAPRSCHFPGFAPGCEDFFRCDLNDAVRDAPGGIEQLGDSIPPLVWWLGALEVTRVHCKWVMKEMNGLIRAAASCRNRRIIFTGSVPDAGWGQLR
jgi:hypothetical protein